MFAIKYTPDIFLISVYVSSLFQQDICSVKVCVSKNWEQLFLSKLILYLSGQEYGIYSHSSLIYSQVTYETSTRKKFSTRENTHKIKFGPTKYEKKFHIHEIPTRKNVGPTKYPPEKIKDSRTHGGTMARGPGDPRWHETHGM